MAKKVKVKKLKPRKMVKGEKLKEAKALVKKVQKKHLKVSKKASKSFAKPVKPKKGRTRVYNLPKSKVVTEAKMDAQLRRLKQRKLVPRNATSLIGVTLVREWNGKRYTVRGTKKGWLRKDTGKTFASLFGVACNIVDGPRNGYLFFKSSLKKAEIN